MNITSSWKKWRSFFFKKREEENGKERRGASCEDSLF